jgi:hypothetical protein
MLYSRFRDENGKLWVIDQWGDRFEPIAMEPVTYYLPMWDPTYIYTSEEHPCAHVTLKYREGWTPDMVDFKPLSCTECKWIAEGLGVDE